MTTPKDYMRVYTPNRGKVAHLIWEPDWDRVPGGYPHAACGWWGQQTYWRGTGSQDEYEKAEALPLCQRCLNAINRT